MGSTFEVRVGTLVWAATAAVLAVAATLIISSAWSADAAPGDLDATYVSTAGCRAFDYRPAPDQVGDRPTPLGAGEIHTQQITGGVGACVGALAVPTDAVAVAMNVTVVNPTAQSNLRLYTADLSEVPLLSNLNFSAGQAPFPNKVDVALSPGGAVKIFNQYGSVSVVGDVVGYYTKASLTDLDARLAALEADNVALKAQVAALQSKTAPMTVETVEGQPTVRFNSVNVQVVDGSGTTVCAGGSCNGRGNLIIGYNEDTGQGGDALRTGSHNVVSGVDHSYSSWSGVVFGQQNSVLSPASTVTGGTQNTANGNPSSVAGGRANTASGFYSSVAGGFNNTASGSDDAVAGGDDVVCDGLTTRVCGDGLNGPL